MGARSVVTYSDFSGGEAGELSVRSSDKAPRNGFAATDMFVNTAGLLCTRPGLLNITPSGLSNGLVHGFGNTPVPDNDLWFVQGTAVRTFSSAGNNLKTSGTALAEVPSQPLDWKVDTTSVVIASAADKLYRITPQSGVTVPTVAGLTGSPGAAAVEIYGDRVVAANIDGSFGYRVRFSDVADPNSWPAGNFFDVGDGFGVTGLYSQRQHLLVTKQNQIHAVTGVLGDGAVQRRLYSGDGPLHPLHARMGPADAMWYQHLFAKHPASFNGSFPNELAHLAYGSADPNSAGATAIPLHNGVVPFSVRGGGVVFLDSTGNSAVLYSRGVWTYHFFGVNISGYAASNGQYIYFCDGGAGGATPNFYRWDMALDSPGSGSMAGDGSSTALGGYLEFPNWWTQDGSEVLVRAVVVDFAEFNTGSATTNHFDLTVVSKRQYQANETSSTTVSYDAVTSTTTRRRVFGFGEQGPGSGFQLQLSNVRGIGISSIQVIIENAPARV